MRVCGAWGRGLQDHRHHGRSAPTRLRLPRRRCTFRRLEFPQIRHRARSQTFIAQFHNVDAPAGTPVSFSVTGANPQGQIGNTDASGTSSFTYTAAHAGTDTIKASSTVGVVNVSSNQAVVTWGSGSHVTFISLNNSPTTGFADQSVSLSATLFDESVTPPSSLSGQQLTLAIDSSSCIATTNSNGVGSCSVTAGAGGSSTLSASFAGAAGYDPSSASEGFKVVASVATTATTPTPPVQPRPRRQPRLRRQPQPRLLHLLL